MILHVNIYCDGQELAGDHRPAPPSPQRHGRAPGSHPARSDQDLLFRTGRVLRTPASARPHGRNGGAGRLMRLARPTWPSRSPADRTTADPRRPANAVSYLTSEVRPVMERQPGNLGITRAAARRPRRPGRRLREGAAGGASVASLLGAGYALHLAGQKNGAPRMLMIAGAVLTAVLSWVVINTVYTLRYADQHFRSEPCPTCSASSSSQARSTSSAGWCGKPRQTYRSRRRYADAHAARIAAHKRSDSEMPGEQ
jgi:hypothetical protein